MIRNKIRNIFRPDKNKARIISYPKSGRTWIRYVLYNLDISHRFVFSHDGFDFNDGAMPSLDFSVSRRLETYGKFRTLIYLERDPRDVMVSMYHQVTGRFAADFGYGGSISDFIRHPYFGAQSLKGFRDMWEEIGDTLPLLRVSYEDMTANPAQTMRTIAHHAGLRIDPGRLARACDDGSLENMRQAEREGRVAQSWLKPRNGYPKVRRGRVGGHVDELSAADIAYLNEVFFEAHPEIERAPQARAAFG